MEKIWQKISASLTFHSISQKFFQKEDMAAPWARTLFLSFFLWQVSTTKYTLPNITKGNEMPSRFAERERDLEHFFFSLSRFVGNKWRNCASALGIYVGQTHSIRHGTGTAAANDDMVLMMTCNRCFSLFVCQNEAKTNNKNEKNL